MTFSYDETAAAGYVHVTGGRDIDRSIAISDGVVVDIAEDNVVVGVEILGSESPDRFLAGMVLVLVAVLRHCEFKDDPPE